jgi:hypothetical protein
MDTLTKQKLVLVHNIGGTEINRSENDDGRVVDAIEQCHDKHKNSLWVDHSVVDHWWCVKLCIVCI